MYMYKVGPKTDVVDRPYMFVMDSLFTDLHIFRVLGKMFRVPWQIGKLVQPHKRPPEVL